LNKSSRLAPALDVTKLITLIQAHFVVLLNSDLEVKQIGFWGQFAEQKLVLSSNFRCDQIYKNGGYDFGHTLLCYLSLTKMFNKPTTGFWHFL